MKQVTWKKSCSSVSSGAPNGVCKISHTGGKQAVRADLGSAVQLLSMRAGCQSLANSDQTVNLGCADPIWINIHVTLMPISHLKCFQNHLVVHGLAVKWESMWRNRHCKICWRTAKFRSHDRSTANRNANEMTCDWTKSPSRDFSKPKNRAMRRCRSLAISQNTWSTICWKVIMEFLPNDTKNILPTATLTQQHSTKQTWTLWTSQSTHLCAARRWKIARKLQIPDRRVQHP